MKGYKTFTNQELKEILADHKLWLETDGEQGKKANLSHADLRHADLSNADLSNADLSNADLSFADLRHTDLRYADLRHADLLYANLDYSAFPLWCGGLDVHIDDKQFIQLLYHAVQNALYSKNTSKAVKKLCSMKSIINMANKFHRAEKCGEIVIDKTKARRSERFK